MRHLYQISGDNNINYLKLCLKSIKNNSKFNHEIIIHVNEGSDGTLDFIKENNYIHTFSEKNIGLCSSVNTAALLATTEFILYNLYYFILCFI